MARKTSAVAANDYGVIAQYNNLRDEAEGSSRLLPYQQSSPNLTLKVAQGVIYFGGIALNFAGGDSPSFTAPSSDPRIDVLSIDPSGTLVRTAGTPAASPVAPTIPSSHIPICSVYNRSGQTSIKTVDDTVNGYIYRDLRPFLKDDGSVLSFTADEDLAVGTPVGISNYSPSRSVARAVRKSISNSLGITGSGSLTQNLSRIFPVGGNKFVVLVRENGTNNLYAVAVSIDPNTKEVTGTGTPALVTSNYVTSLDIYAGCGLGTDKFIVFYRENASSTIMKSRVGTISTLTISYGTAQSAFTGSTDIDEIQSDGLATDKGVVIAHCGTQADSRVIAFTVSGTTATYGTPASVNSNITNSLALKKTGTDKFCLFSTSGYAQAATISGTTITMGTALQAVTTITSDTGMFDALSPATDVLVVRYRLSGSNTQCAVVCLTISGTTITAGTPISGVVDSGGFLLYDTSTSILVYSDTQAIYRFTRSGATLTNQGIVIRAFAGSSSYKAVALASGLNIMAGFTGANLVVWIPGMSNNFIGVVKTAVSKGGSAQVQVAGINGDQSGKIAGGTYQALNGTFTLINGDATVNSLEDIFVVKAVSDTEILI